MIDLDTQNGMNQAKKPVITPIKGVVASLASIDKKNSTKAQMQNAVKTLAYLFPAKNNG